MDAEGHPDLTKEVPGRRTDELLTNLADRVGARFAASTVFGTAVERNGVTVIPVASGRFMFGGGGGSGGGEGEEGEGHGAGAGGVMRAVGYIELRDGMSRFVPVVSPLRIAGIVAAAGVAIAFVRR